MGDMRTMMNIDMERFIPKPRGWKDELNRKMKVVQSMLRERAEHLTLEGKTNDAEDIYTRILGSYELRYSTMTSLDILSTLVLTYEKTGNFSAAEEAQECLLQWTINSGVECEDKVTLEAHKLRHLYTLFYNRIRSATIQHGDDGPIGANLARTIMFSRVAALNIKSWNRLTKPMELPNNALHIAVAAGATHLIEGLLNSSGCDINTTDEDGRTALHIAVQDCQASMVQLLVDKGIDLEVVDREGDPALLLALAQTSEQAFGITKALLDRGSDVKVRNCLGQTTLSLAVQYGTSDLTSSMLSCGLEIDAPNFIGSTPLMIVAARSGAHDCILIALQLINSGANVKAVNDSGYTPLISASQFGDTKMVQLLITKGAAVNARDCRGRTALHQAATRTEGIETEIISILIEGGIDIEVQDNEGTSALGVALKCGTIAAAQKLLEHGADLEPKTGGDTL